jgi:hypothetical protein
MIRRLLMRICGWTWEAALDKDNGIKTIRRAHENFLRKRGYKKCGKNPQKFDRMGEDKI